MFTARNKLPIGIDLGFDAVKLLQLAVMPDGLAVKAAAWEAVAPSDHRIDTAVRALGSLLRRHAFQGRAATVALPREMVMVKNLRLPAIPEAELQAAIRFEAETLFAAPADQLEIRHIAAGEVRHGSEIKQEVIVLAAVREKVDQFVEALHQAGVVVDGLEFEPVAAYRGLGRLLRRAEDETETTVLVDVGWRQTQVTIGRGREISFFKTIDLAGRQFNQAVGRRLGLEIDEARSLRWRFAGEPEPSADMPRDPVRSAVVEASRQLKADLAREIGLCLRYHSVTFRGQRAARVRLTGGESADTQLLGALRDALPIPVEIFDPLFGVDAKVLSSVRHTATNGEWSAAFGLATRHLKSDRLSLTPLLGTSVAGRRVDDINRVEVIETAGAVEEPVVQGETRTRSLVGVNGD